MNKYSTIERDKNEEIILDKQLQREQLDKALQSKEQAENALKTNI